MICLVCKGTGEYSIGVCSIPDPEDNWEFKECFENCIHCHGPGIIKEEKHDHSDTSRRSGLGKRIL